MRLGLAGESVRTRAKALVLGPRSISGRIGEELDALGFTPVFEASLELGLPQPSVPGALDALRDLLRKFIDVAGPSESGYAHILHPGTGPWAERAELASIGQEFGLNVIGPPVRVLSLFSNKLSLLVEADRLGIATLATSLDPIHSVREIEASMKSGTSRFPFVLKSVRGGSGHGIYVVHSPEDLDTGLPLWLEQLRRGVGEVMLFTERYVEGARRIVAPFARFKDGRSAVLPLVDASLQSRFRKVIEFCPAVGLEPASERQIKEWTLRIIEQVGYVGVGALEYFVDGNRAYLVEGVARLNTGFRLWEQVAGIRAVEWQIAAFEGPMGGSAAITPPKPLAEWTHAVGLRLYAEDPVLQLPQPGWIREISERRHWRFPRAEGVLDLPAQPGTRLDSQGDPLLGQLFVGAQEARQSLSLARGILDEFWIAGGIQTNDRFLSELLLHPWIQSGMYHSSFVEEEFIPEIRPPSELLSVFASIAAMAESSSVDPNAHRWSVGDQWAKPDHSLIHWKEKPEYFLEKRMRGLSGVLILPDGRTPRVCAFPVGPARWKIRIGSWTLTVRQTPAARAKKDPLQPLPLLSLVSGRIHSLLFREQALVPAHQTLLIIESLRTLVPHALPGDARVLQWKVAAEDCVEAGQELAAFEILRS